MAIAIGLSPLGHFCPPKNDHDPKYRGVSRMKNHPIGLCSLCNSTHLWPVIDADDGTLIDVHACPLCGIGRKPPLAQESIQGPLFDYYRDEIRRNHPGSYKRVDGRDSADLPPAVRELLRELRFRGIHPDLLETRYLETRSGLWVHLRVCNEKVSMLNIAELAKAFSSPILRAWMMETSAPIWRQIKFCRHPQWVKNQVDQMGPISHRALELGLRVGSLRLFKTPSPTYSWVLDPLDSPPLSRHQQDRSDARLSEICALLGIQTTYGALVPFKVAIAELLALLGELRCLPDLRDKR